jgi:hypothetical protein
VKAASAPRSRTSRRQRRVRDEVFTRSGLLEHYLGWLGEIRFIYSSQDEHGLSSNCFVGPDWQQAELYIRLER